VTNRFVWVSWNRHKRVYDALLAGAMALYLVVFAGISIGLAEAPVDPMVLAIRAMGTLAIAMLHIILCIGPLSRFTDRVAPLLYNRRHFGVAMFCVALVHGALVLLYYGGFGVVNPFAAVLLEGRSFASVGSFPYELLGFVALLILFLMAATSHDFWLDLLGASVWKWMHMGVYAAYALLVGQVVLGSVADSVGGGRGALSLWMIGGGAVIVATLHLLAGLREIARDETGRRAIERDEEDPTREGWVEIGPVDDIPEGRAKVVCLGALQGGGGLRGERIAVFRHGGKVSAVTNVCAHQGGPLGEGRIVDGCVTCPWHGYQFGVEDGRSPPPYTEKIATYRVRVEGRTVLVHPVALTPGTRVDPAFFEASADDEALFEEPDVDRADSTVHPPGVGAVEPPPRRHPMDSPVELERDTDVDSDFVDPEGETRA
jgi:sulfoxide reductase heme-binding subunit YedZ